MGKMDTVHDEEIYVRREPEGQSTSTMMLNMRKKQIKAVGWHFTCIKLAKVKSDHSKPWLGCGQVGTLIPAGDKVNLCYHFGEQLASMI